MSGFQTFILLMFVAAVLVGMAQKLRIVYPIALVLGGTAIGFIHQLHSVNFDPNLILFIVLPPIIYYAAFRISFRDFKENWRDIFSLALGLVLVTTIVIGIIFKLLFPQFSWALAFAFGALVSPPDAVAATTILKQFSISPRLLSILEGESLINDASALVLYKVAVTAILSGAFSLGDAGFEFFKDVSGGVILGFVLGFIIQRFSRNFFEPIIGVVFSFTIPYVTWILADYLEVSGVLAVVVNGLIGSQMLVKHPSSQRRIVGFAAWHIFSILMNCFVFILIGLQLRTITGGMSFDQLILYTFYALLITLAMIVVRFIWVYAKSGISYLKALTRPKASTICPQIVNDAILISWSGMRGIVSLTAALALPLYLPEGNTLQGRNEVIFITFVVILLTLMIPGLTLSTLIRWLNIHHHIEHRHAHKARKELVNIAKEKIHHLHKSNTITHEEFEFLMSYFILQRSVLEISSSQHKKMQKLESVRQELIKEQRKYLLEMWEKLEIDDRLLNQLENELDVAETQISRAELK